MTDPKLKQINNLIAENHDIMNDDELGDLAFLVDVDSDTPSMFKTRANALKYALEYRDGLSRVNKKSSSVLEKAIKKTVKESKKSDEGSGRKKKLENYEDFEPFFEDYLKDTRKCLLSECVMVKEKSTWKPLDNELGAMKSHAIGENLSPYLLEAHLQRYVKTMDYKLLCNIPEWDGIDRIDNVLKFIKVNNISHGAFVDLFKEWFSNMFRRLKDPMHQNKLIVLQGSQGKGKDTFIANMLGGLDPYFSNLTVTRNHNDTFQTMAQRIAINISEFDQTAKIEVSVIKDMITKDRANFRAPYARRPADNIFRCSFISSCNMNDILRDWTGNRRFVIFEIESIDWNYPKGDRAQLVAQYQHLGESRYVASASSHVEMNNYIEGKTPDDPNKHAIDIYLSGVESLESHTSTGCPINGWRLTDIKHLMNDIKNITGIPPKRQWQLLKDEGYSRKIGGTSRYFSTKEPQT